MIASKYSGMKVREYYAPDQPRDDSGKWVATTSGGPTQKSIQKMLDKEFPGAKLGFDYGGTEGPYVEAPDGVTWREAGLGVNRLSHMPTEKNRPGRGWGTDVVDTVRQQLIHRLAEPTTSTHSPAGDALVAKAHAHIKAVKGGK